LESDPRLSNIQQNGGGIIGLEEAVCAVAIYER